MHWVTALRAGQAGSWWRLAEASNLVVCLGLPGSVVQEGSGVPVGTKQVTQILTPSLRAPCAPGLAGGSLFPTGPVVSTQLGGNGQHQTCPGVLGPRKPKSSSSDTPGFGPAA